MEHIDRDIHRSVSGDRGLWFNPWLHPCVVTFITALYPNSRVVSVRNYYFKINVLILNLMTFSLTVLRLIANHLFSII